eukprot:6874745-Alexandrium_andersonii.AAC.1
MGRARIKSTIRRHPNPCIVIKCRCCSSLRQHMRGSMPDIPGGRNFTTRARTLSAALAGTAVRLARPRTPRRILAPQTIS